MVKISLLHCEVYIFFLNLFNRVYIFLNDVWSLSWNGITKNVYIKTLAFPEYLWWRKMFKRRFVYFRLRLEESTSSLVEFSVEKCRPFLYPFIFSVPWPNTWRKKPSLRSQVSFWLKVWEDIDRQQKVGVWGADHSMSTIKEQRVVSTNNRSLSLFNQPLVYGLGSSPGHVLIS